MSVFPIENQRAGQTFRRKDAPIHQESIQRVRNEIRRQQVVTFILLVIFVYQIISLPGAIMMKSTLSIASVILGILLCGIAMLFNRLGHVGVVSILLICVVDLGCGLMLLDAPMGLDTSSLPVFDLLVVSELIAASLLPTASIFPVAISNILFIIGMITFMPHSPELTMALHSNMAYDMIMQPISLQIVVAAITYMWVRSALRAAARADRAEEVAELQQVKASLQQREIEQKRLLDGGIHELLQALVQASNGRVSRINLSQDHVLWQVSNAINLLLTRLHRTQQAEQENQQLRFQLLQLRERLYRAERMGRQQETPPPQKSKNSSSSSFPGL